MVHLARALACALALPALFQGSSGLIGYWPLDALNTTTTPDASGSGNTGTISGSPTLAAGRIGMAMSFTGTGQSVRVANSIPDDFTVALWINTTSAGPASGTNAYEGNGIVWSDVGGAGNDMIPLAVLNGKLVFGTGNAGGYDNLTSVAAINSSGVWFHAAVTRVKSTGAKKLYINGALDNSSTGGTESLNANASIDIGGNTLDMRFFNGLLDDVRFYNRALSDSEVSELSKGPPSPAGLTATAAAGQVDLSWSAPAGGVLSYTYNVYRGTTAGSHPQQVGTNVAATTFSDTTGTTGTDYYYIVQAVSSIGASPDSNEAGPAAPSAGAGGAPGAAGSGGGGSDHNRCGCGVADVAGGLWLGAAALAALGLLFQKGG